MQTHILATEIFLPHQHAEVFAFFSDAANLQTLTPRWLHFKILTPLPVRMSRGTIIDYQLRLYGVPMRWQSEITVWDPPFRFVDVQTRGPYRHWVHSHTFQARDGGTICRDWLEYAVPGGAVVNWLFVAEEVKKIFHYRQRELQRIFK